MPAIDNIIIARQTLITGFDLLNPLNSLIFSTYELDFLRDKIIENTAIFITR